MALTTANPSTSAPIIPTLTRHTAASPLNRHLWQNPYFQRDAVRIRHSQTPGTFARRTLMLLAFATVFTVFVYVVYIAPDWLADKAIYTSGTAVMFAGFISVVSLPMLDAAAARAGMNAANYDLVLDVDDFAAMSDDERRKYVRGRHGLAQVMAWRLAMLFTGLRLVVVVMLLMQLAELAQSIDQSYMPLMIRFAHDPSSFALLIIAAVPLLACFLLEPLWRLRLMTAWGVRSAVSSQTRLAESIRLSLIPLVYWGLTGAFYLLSHHLFMTEVNPYPFYIYGGYSVTAYTQVTLNSTVDPFIARMLSSFRDPAAALLGGTVLYCLLVMIYHEIGTRLLRRGSELKLADAPNVSQRHAQLEPLARDIDPPYAQPNLRVRLLSGMSPPRSLWSHPAFVMGARGMRRGRTRRDLGSFTALQVLRSLVAAGLVTLIWTLARWETYQQMFSYGTYYSSRPIDILSTYLGEVTIIILLISLGLSLYMDVASMLSGLNTINADMVAGRWDTLRITALPEADLIRIKHGVTQLRTWRAFVTLLTLRVTVLALFLVLMFIELSDTDGTSWLRYLATDTLRSPGTFTIGMFWVVLLLGVFFIEPIIRLRTVAMIGVANSVGRDTIRALMTGFAWVIAFWISQVALTALVVYGFQVIQNLIIRALIGEPTSYQAYSWLFNSTAWMLFITSMYILLPPLFLLIHYQNYRFLRWVSRRRVMQQAFDT